MVILAGNVRPTVPVGCALEGEPALIAGNGFVEPAQVLEHVSEVVVGGSKPGIYGERLPIARDGVVVSAGYELRIAEGGVQAGGARLHGDSALEKGDGLVRTATPGGDFAEKEKRYRLIRIGGQNFPAGRDGLVELLRPMILAGPTKKQVQPARSGQFVKRSRCR